jgi:hypothetical protein
MQRTQILKIFCRSMPPDCPRRFAPSALMLNKISIQPKISAVRGATKGGKERQPPTQCFRVVILAIHSNPMMKNWGRG